MSSDPVNESQVKDRAALVKAIHDAVAKAVERSKRCCFNCASFKEPNLYCMMHNGNPPPRVVAFGCDSYMPSDEIPF